MRQAHFMLLGFSALVLTVLAADSSAQFDGSASNSYVKAIYAVIQRYWGPESYSTELEPGSRCEARIVQLPGGEVLRVEFLQACDFSGAGRASIVDALSRAAPLPYYGFENVFQREIRMVFHAASASDRRVRSAEQAATEQAIAHSAESNRQREESVGSQIRNDEYFRRCSFHLGWEVSAVRLQHPTTIVATIDRSGKVIGVAVAKGEVVDERLVTALSAAPPCEQIPADIAVGARMVEIGPIVFGQHSN